MTERGRTEDNGNKEKDTGRRDRVCNNQRVHTQEYPRYNQDRENGHWKLLYLEMSLEY